VRQQETAHSASTQQLAAEQHTERSSLFAFARGFVNLFSFHVSLLVKVWLTSATGFDRRYLGNHQSKPEKVQTRRECGLAALWGRNAFMFIGVALRSAMKQATQDQSLKNPSPDRTAEESAYQDSPKGYFLFILVPFVGLEFLSKHGSDARFESFFECPLNLFHFIFSGKLRELLLGELLPLTGLVELLDLHDSARRRIDRHNQLLFFGSTNRFSP